MKCSNKVRYQPPLHLTFEVVTSVGGISCKRSTAGFGYEGIKNQLCFKSKFEILQCKVHAVFLFYNLDLVVV